MKTTYCQEINDGFDDIPWLQNIKKYDANRNNFFYELCIVAVIRIASSMYYSFNLTRENVSNTLIRFSFFI